MQPANLARNAPQASAPVASPAMASLAPEDSAVTAAQSAHTEKTAAGTARTGDDPTTNFADELAQVAEVQPPLPPPDVMAPAELPVTEADAEQWLQQMLAQQSAQLQARDAEQGSADETGVTIDTATRDFSGGLVAQEFTEQTENDQPLNLATETLRASAEPLKTSTEKHSALTEVLTAGKERTSLSGAIGTHVEKVKPDPAVTESESVHQPLLAQPERLSAGAADSEVTTRIDPTLTNTPVTESAALERTLKLQGPEIKWGEQLLLALRENVELHVQQRVQNTTIRLDPPELGVMEIILTHEQGRLNVQISAQHSDVVRLLQQTSDRLRHELVAQNFTQVDVEISGGQAGQHHSQRDQARLFNEQSVGANRHDADQSDAHHLAPEQQASIQHNGVLVTV